MNTLKSKRFENNTGFTLVELLIAVAILAAVIIPFAANFALTAKVNQKARNNLRTTSMVQNMMEEISAVSSKDIIIQFDNILVNPNLEILPAGATVTNFGELDSLTGKNIVFDKSSSPATSQYGVFVSGNSVDVKQSPNNTYYLFAQNVKVGNNTYDMRFKLDGSTYVEPSPGAVGAYYNSDLLASVAGVNPIYDSVYVDPADDLREKCDAFLLRTSNASVVAKDIKDNLIREINLTIDDLDPSTAEDIGVKIGTTYTCNNNSLLGISNSEKQIATTPVLIYQSGISKKDPRNIYIYLKGNISSTSSNPLDTINIDNMTTKPVTVYIIRENVNDSNQDPLFPNNTSMATELNYSLKVNLTDKNTVLSELYTKICTNAGNDLSKPINEKQVQNGQSRAYYTVNSSSQLDESQFNQVVKGLDNATKQDRIFKLTVEIYKPGAVAEQFADPKKLITSFDGGTYQ